MHGIFYFIEYRLLSKEDIYMAVPSFEKLLFTDPGL